MLHNSINENAMHLRELSHLTIDIKDLKTDEGNATQMITNHPEYWIILNSVDLYHIRLGCLWPIFTIFTIAFKIGAEILHLQL